MEPTTAPLDLEVRAASLIDDAVGRLGLDPLCAAVLLAFWPLETDREVAAQLRVDDVHTRPGVLAWAALVEMLRVQGAHVGLSELERAVCDLADWSLVQLVGQQPADPPVSGSAAMRLTFAGRAALGLAPTRRRPPPPNAAGWSLFHGASREATLLAAWSELGVRMPESSDLPVLLSTRPDHLDHAVGLVAQRLVTVGQVVVDGYDLHERDGGPQAASASILEALLARTAGARGPRILLLPDPSLARVAALLGAGTLRWVEPNVAARRGGAVLDERLDLALAGGRTDPLLVADLTGVPDSELAAPRRVSTAWEDMLLPQVVQQEFEQALMHARYRLRLNAGGAGGAVGARGPGYRLLLSGLPGTGKSMAAEALATTLDRPLIKLDLSSVLSKWLGETEKLLAQVFDVAESAGAVLVLDEAESLLRQRESGSQGNHALATGVAYLLTRLERFSGVLVATTNRTKDLDEAFFRRFDDYIILPLPDEPTRARLWTRHLALEVDQLPTVDLRLLAHRFPISGGLIRGAAVRARSWALGLDEPLSTPLALAALGRELEKSDRASSEVFVEPHSGRVRELLRGRDTVNGRRG